mmetsp:Transcript_20933/g.67361  ORF Transcript_20933/g.67361 Transcript_20933/m.67361 type:complete len:228 (+) Transcript_20933:1486-2169(+)
MIHILDLLALDLLLERVESAALHHHLEALCHVILVVDPPQRLALVLFITTPRFLLCLLPRSLLRILLPLQRGLELAQEGVFVDLLRAAARSIRRRCCRHRCTVALALPLVLTLHIHTTLALALHLLHDLLQRDHLGRFGLLRRRCGRRQAEVHLIGSLSLQAAHERVEWVRLSAVAGSSSWPRVTRSICRRGRGRGGRHGVRGRRCAAPPGSWQAGQRGAADGRCAH